MPLVEMGECYLEPFAAASLAVLEGWPAGPPATKLKLTARAGPVENVLKYFHKTIYWRRISL